MRKFILLLVLILALTSVAVYAQDGFPDNGIDYTGYTLDQLNWCNAGQPWAGQCNVADGFTTEWLWAAGWYYAHFNLGLINEIPEMYRAKDTDGDGVPDSEDLCPNVYGNNLPGTPIHGCLA